MRSSSTLLFGIFLLFILPFHDALVVPLSAAKPTESLMGVSLPKVNFDNDANNLGADAEYVDIGAELGRSGATDNSSGRTMVVFGTHAGDFNTIEYMQKVRAFLPKLESKGGIDRILFIVNGEPDQIKLLADLLDFPTTSASVDITLLSDPTGEAGRKFGVSRGFRPDDTSLSPFAKEFASGIGIGPPWGTLPAVLPGYFGDPDGTREWIETSLKQGQLAGRWPAILELDDRDGSIVSNKFDDAPLGLNEWGRRPFELATLRLQSLIGIQIKHWSKLKPVDDRCLTQHGGCTVVGEDGSAVYSWLDKGLCDVPDMNDVLEELSE
eukprot:CAMPEP_0172540698 /NCGR_PEP_ID=MMETSP1067-20121228/11648_1 /TAXON_ID=265564 ORGANISM="Thalassiosira punctigera, Strain Tpunct2005C2" /NCGR_SAMPLE_ID=MMETSP1067 /ASSEMBLY_ACC=CAM_ASM_000444 /LENGTH=323 /DNA_ID=CAMNT_0013326601 /DNA_START=726 /DNA_END=1697 /DNA_ORIENTATION=+